MIDKAKCPDCKDTGYIVGPGSAEVCDCAETLTVEEQAKRKAAALQRQIDEQIEDEEELPF